MKLWAQPVLMSTHSMRAQSWEMGNVRVHIILMDRKWGNNWRLPLSITFALVEHLSDLKRSCKPMEAETRAVRYHTCAASNNGVPWCAKFMIRKPFGVPAELSRFSGASGRLCRNRQLAPLKAGIGKRTDCSFLAQTCVRIHASKVPASIP